MQPASVDSFARENRGSVLSVRVDICGFLLRAWVVAESGYVRVDLCDGPLDKCVNLWIENLVDYRILHPHYSHDIS